MDKTHITHLHIFMAAITYRFLMVTHCCHDLANFPLSCKTIDSNLIIPPLNCLLSWTIFTGTDGWIYCVQFPSSQANIKDHAIQQITYLRRQYLLLESTHVVT